MATYRNRFRVSRLTKKVRDSVTSLLKGDVPTYILNDVRERLDNGENEIVISMVISPSVSKKSIVEYLNEYHNRKNYGWRLEFLHKAFEYVSAKIHKGLSRYKDIEIEVFDFSDTDKRITIKLIE